MLDLIYEFTVIIESQDLLYNNIESQKYAVNLIYEKPLFSIDLLTDCVYEGETFTYQLKYRGFFLKEIVVDIECSNSNNIKEILIFNSTTNSLDYSVSSKVDGIDKEFIVECLFNITSLDTRFNNVRTKSKVLENIDHASVNINRIEWPSDLVYNERMILKVSLETIPIADVVFKSTSYETNFTPMIFNNSNWNFQQIQEFIYLSAKLKTIDIIFTVESLDPKYSRIEILKHSIELYPHDIVTNATVLTEVNEHKSFVAFFYLSYPPSSSVKLDLVMCNTSKFFCSDPNSSNNELKKQLIFIPENYNRQQLVKIQLYDDLVYNLMEASTRTFLIRFETSDSFYSRLANLSYSYLNKENDYPQISVSYQDFISDLISGSSKIILYKTPFTPVTIKPHCPSFMVCSDSVEKGDNNYEVTIAFPFYNDTEYEGNAIIDFNIESTNPVLDGITIEPFTFVYRSIAYDVILSYSFNLPLQYNTSGLVYFHFNKNILEETSVVVNCTIIRCQTETFSFTPENVFIDQSIQVYNDVPNELNLPKGLVNFYIFQNSLSIKKTHTIEIVRIKKAELIISTKSGNRMFANEYSEIYLSLSSKPLDCVKLMIISDDISLFRLGLSTNYIIIQPNTFNVERLITFTSPPVSGDYNITFSLISEDSKYTFDSEYKVHVYDQRDILFDCIFSPMINKGDTINIPVSIEKPLLENLSINFYISSKVIINPSVLNFNSSNWFLMKNISIQTANDLLPALSSENIRITTSIPGYLPSEISLVLLPTVNLKIQFNNTYLRLKSGTIEVLGVKLPSQPFQPVTLAVSSTYNFIKYSLNELLFNDLNYNEYQYINVQLLSEHLPYDGFFLNLIKFSAQSSGMYNGITEEINGYVFDGYYGPDLSPTVSSAYLQKNIKFMFPVLVDHESDSITCSDIFTSQLMIIIGHISQCCLADDYKLIKVTLNKEETLLKSGDMLQFIYGKVSKINNSFFSVVEQFKITLPTVYLINTASFNSKGTIITLSFSNPITIIVGNISCSSLFINKNLGVDCIAQVSEDHVDIYLGYSFSIKPSRFSNICEKDSSIYLIDQKLISRENQEKFYSGCRSVNFALDDPLLSPVIQGPRHVSKCEKIINYYGEFRTKENINQMTYSWSISSLNNINPDLTDYVKSVNTSLLGIPVSYLATNILYKLELEVSNIFRLSPEKTFLNFELKPLSALTIKLNKPNEYKVKVSDTIDIHPIFTYIYCSFSEIPTERFFFEWISDFDVDKYINNDKLLIPPHSLSPYSKVRVNLTIQLSGIIIFNDHINIEVIALPFIYSLPPYIIINSKDTLVLDASSTEDPDDNSPEFIFNWICNGCPPFIAEKSFIRFYPNTFQPYFDYELELETINKIKTFRYVVVIKVVSEGPSLWIEGKLYNVRLHETLSAIAKSFDQNITYEWTVEKYDDSIIERKNSDKVIVSPYFLEVGSKFELNLKAINRNNEETRYYLMLNGDFYPESGYIEINPKKGVALETIFVITTAEWKGDCPFKYKFGFIINNIEYLLTADFVDDNKYSTVLPSQIGENKIEIVVYIKSRYGIVKRSQETLERSKAVVEVFSYVNTINDLNDLINDSPLLKSADTLIIGTISVMTMIPDQCNFLNCGSGECVNNTCICPSSHSGVNCEIMNPVNGGWSEWERYPCTLGYQVLSRTCSNPKPHHGGMNCPGDDLLAESCGDTNNTLIYFSAWTNWTECDAECSSEYGKIEGKQYRRRVCINGNICEGLYKESRECTIYCTYPEKPCPGQYSENGKVIGSECSGNGICIKTKEECTVDDLNCKVKCQCNGEYGGDKCQIKKSDKELITPIINSLLERIMNISNEEGINELYCHFLSYLVLYNDIIDRDIFKTSISIVNNNLNGISNTCYDLLLDYASRLFLSLSYQDERDKKFDEAIVGLTKKIPIEINKNLIIGESYIKDYDSFRVTERKLNSKHDSELFDNSVNVKISSKIMEEGKQDSYSIEIITWKQNIYSEIENISSPIVSLSILSDDKVMNIKELSIPITYSQVLSTKASGEKAVCQYYNKETKSYSTDGVYTLYMTDLDEDNIIIYCSTTHLSDFVTFDKSFLPKMNIVNPIKDVSLLANYNSSNFLVPLVLSILFVLFIALWVFMLKKDKAEKYNIIREKYLSYTFKGKIDNKIKSKSFWDTYKISLTDKHLWLGVASNIESMFVVITRAQRTVILFCCILTDFAVLALFFSETKENLGQVISSSIISCFIMLPVSLILPEMFTYANNLKSPNLKINVYSRLVQKYEDSSIHRARNIFAFTGTILFGLSLLMLFPIFVIFKVSYLSLLFALANIAFMVFAGFILLSKSSIRRSNFLNISTFSVLFSILFLIIFILSCLPISSFRGIWKLGKSNTLIGSICYDIETLFSCVGFNDNSDLPFHDIETSPSFIIMDTLVSCKQYFNKKKLVLKLLLIPYSLIFLALFITSTVYGIKLYKKCNKINTEKKTDLGLNDAAIKMQRWFRNKKNKIYIPRRIEFRNWMKNVRVRTIIVCLTYSICICYIFVMLFINLIYGVKFSPKQSYNWLSACGLSLLIDFLIQQV